ncbi:MAG: EAL domain-containing protein, partial [Candidatus Manganitrophaceae bacterium]
MKPDHASPTHTDEADSIIDHMMNALIVIDPDGTIQKVNPATCRLLGYEKEELLGRPIDMVFADDAPFKGIGSGLFENTYLAKDGRRIPVLISGSVLLDDAGQIGGIISLAQDITERKNSEEALRAAEARFRGLLEIAPDAIVVVNADGGIAMMNEQAETMFGYAREEILGKPMEILLPERLREAHVEHRRRYNDLPRRRPMGSKPGLLGKRKDGSEFPVEIGLGPMQTEEGLLVMSIIRDITERKRSEERLQYLAHHDSLTGLLNRTFFIEHLQMALKSAARQSRIAAVLFLDLDRFKLVNDTLGHATGDLLLKAVAERLTSCLRRGDAVARMLDQSDTVARLGGDEFTLLLTGIEQAENVPHIAQRILKMFSTPFFIEGHELFLTPSIGISLYPNDGDNAEKLLRNADAALYRAKEQGRNHFQFYTSEMNAKIAERLALENRLRKAVEQEELLLHFQPQVDLTTGKVFGMEALVRWHPPEMGMVSPAKFIPLAEETGLIIPIGEWVLRTACAQNKKWQEKGLPVIRMTVNLSGRQFQQIDLIEMVGRILSESGLSAKDLELELTESTLMQKFQTTTAALSQLDAMGIELSIDDFGTGYSSLSYLKRFPISKLKVDRSFI